MSSQSAGISSVCVYCASSGEAPPSFFAAARAFGELLASEGLGLVYGGGGVGLMGACAAAAHKAGGRVLGVIPDFLIGAERPLASVETVVVRSMHERKMRMFQAADAFAVLPGGIGTLEEVIELLSWRRLGLHAKPIVFLNLEGYWTPLFALFAHIRENRLVPPEFDETWRAVDEVEGILPAMAEAPSTAFATPPGVERIT
jgi:uncharacterized protein (TIGR00730 family)